MQPALTEHQRPGENWIGRPDVEMMDRLKRTWHTWQTHPRQDFVRRRTMSRQARRCWWINQSDSGRKEVGVNGNPPFPWKGATDFRYRLVDQVINEDAAVLVSALTPGGLRVMPVQAGLDSSWASRMTALARWLLFSEMTEFQREANLLAEWMLEDGAAALMVYWDRRERLVPEVVTIGDLEQWQMELREALSQVGSADQVPGWLLEIADVTSMLQDPTREDDLIAIAKQWLAGGRYSLKDSQWRKIVHDLRIKGRAEIPKVEVYRNRPAIRAMLINEDVYFPPECTQPDDPELVFVREIFTSEYALRVAGQERGWDEKWLEAMVERGGASILPYPMVNEAIQTAQLLSDVEMYEVLTAFHRGLDENGIQRVYLTTFSPHLTDSETDQPMVAAHELLTYAHGRIPILVFTREVKSRLIEDSRGIGEVLRYNQDLLKRMTDAMQDRSDLAVLPPWYYPPGEKPVQWGPGVGIETARPDAFGFFRGPQYDFGSERQLDHLWQQTMRYAGRRLPDGSNEVQAIAMQRRMLNRWLTQWQEAVKMVLQLAQQFAPDTLVARVVGTDQGRPITMSREEIQGAFDVTFQWDPNVMDSDVLKQRLELMQVVLTMDASGRIDRSEATLAALEMIDPSLAERLLVPGESVSDKEVQDEKAVLSRLLVGVDEDIKPGQMYGLRMQVLQALLQTPGVQEALNRSEIAKELVAKRLKQLNFQVQQKEVNPLIGRLLGTKPAEV